MLNFEDLVFGVCSQAVNIILPLFTVKVIFCQLREQFFRY